MKVLLCQDVDRLGYLGDVVDVKNGYARNYLLPQGIAMAPSRANMQSLAEKRATRAQERKLALKKLETVAESINGAEAVIAAKANELGHLFGSVTQREIGKNLRDQGYEVADDMIRLSEHIKEVGTHEVNLKLAAELTVVVNVVVVSEDAVAQAIAEEGQANDESKEDKDDSAGEEEVGSTEQSS